MKVGLKTQIDSNIIISAKPGEKDPSESTAGRLIEEIKRLQTEKSDLCQKLSECQVEVATSHIEIGRLQEMLGQVDYGKPVSDSSHEIAVNVKRSDTVSSIVYKKL